MAKLIDLTGLAHAYSKMKTYVTSAISSHNTDTSAHSTLLSGYSKTDHTHNYAASSSAGGAAKSSNSLTGITTAGTGAAYTATVDGITALTAGVSFIMVPHTVSTATAPTLNVNSLGAKAIRRRVSNSTATTVAGSAASWLTANKPILVTYDGTYWVADIPRANATDIYGTLPIASGGTGAADAATALTNLGAQAAITGTAGQFVVIGTDGKVTTKTIDSAEGASF